MTVRPRRPGAQHTRAQAGRGEPERTADDDAQPGGLGQRNAGGEGLGPHDGRHASFDGRRRRVQGVGAVVGGE